MKFDLTRHDGDKHVMSFNNVEQLYDLMFIDKITSFDEFYKLTKLLNTEAGSITTIPAHKNTASQILIDAVDSDSITQIVAKLSISRLDAAGYFVRNLAGWDHPLYFLKNVPPAHIHSMQRGDYWIGDTYSADFVTDCLADCGTDLGPGMRVLDYGGSSGALVRILAATNLDTDFSACDPVEQSIEWAQTNLTRPNLAFYHQDQRPPLSFDDSAFDIVTAISIWSHHGINAAKLWFDEMARVLRPGGTLLFTTHGVGSLAFYSERQLNSVDRYKQLYLAYLKCGFAFEEVWLSEDDVGNIATPLEWGNSYYDPKVIASLTHTSFDMLKIYPRANQSNQDIYILQKRMA